MVYPHIKLRIDLKKDWSRPLHKRNTANESPNLSQPKQWSLPHFGDVGRG